MKYSNKKVVISAGHLRESDLCHGTVLLLIIRALEDRDFEALARFISEIYSEYPDATWFDSAPSRDTLSDLFLSKLSSMRNHGLIDTVAIENDSVEGECEIVRFPNGTGYVGIIIAKGHRRKGLGSTLLKVSEMLASETGTDTLYAEVSEGNAPARAFFGRSGFEEVGVAQRALPKPSRQNVLLFRKKLQKEARRV